MRDDGVKTNLMFRFGPWKSRRSCEKEGREDSRSSRECGWGVNLKEKVRDLKLLKKDSPAEERDKWTING